jgi:integrase/recombinase XerD
MRKPSWPEVSGPLGCHAAGYRKELSRLGYSPWTASAHMYLMADVSRWLAENEVAPEAFTSARVNHFLADRRAAGRHRRLSPRGLIPLLGFLRETGVLAETAKAEPDGPRERLLTEFVGYLVTERGLAPRTISGYERVAGRFLADCATDTPAKDCGVGDLDARQVNVFLLKDTARLSVGSANNVTTALRALLRFFYVRGFTSTALSGCVPRGACWRDSGRAADLAPGDVIRLLASCDRRTACGRRDFAILTVLSRLGLRASEVAGLILDDLDWANGAVTVCGKGGRRDQLPLPVDVGRALADYCRRGRPRTTHRVVFLHARAPYGPLSYHAIGQVVLAACRRAGLPEVRSHRLRHASACSMRRAGAPLMEIGQVLRHRWAATTALYAKDDLDALASIARPWPVVGS